MDWRDQLDDADIGDALGEALRREVYERADMPAYFWMRQQARIRERLARGRKSLGWVALAMAALVLAAVGLVTQGTLPRAKPTQATHQNTQARQFDPDDVLLEDIQASLQRGVPAPLMPATVLVQEVTRGVTTNSEVKEN